MLMENSNNLYFAEVSDLLDSNNLSLAEYRLNLLKDNSALWHYLYGILLLKKAWYDSSLEELKLAISMDPSNILFKESYLNLIRRNRHYSDDYYYGGYKRHSRGCSCCDCCGCCDCCDCNLSCCDLICLDQCCECMGGDFIECI